MEKFYVNNKGKGWYMTCKGKDKDGSQIVGFLNVAFKKGQEPMGDSAFIEVIDGFHTPYQYMANNGNLVKGIKYFIMEYKLVEKKKEDNSNFGGGQANLGENIGINTDDLPFY